MLQLGQLYLLQHFCLCNQFMPAYSSSHHSVFRPQLRGKLLLEGKRLNEGKQLENAAAPKIRLRVKLGKLRGDVANAGTLRDRSVSYIDNKSHKITIQSFNNRVKLFLHSPFHLVKTLHISEFHYTRTAGQKHSLKLEKGVSFMEILVKAIP